MPFVQLMTSRCRERRGASQADGNVKKICRGKEDKGPVSGEARRLFRIHDDPQRYRERIESNSGIGPFDGSSVRVRSSTTPDRSSLLLSLGFLFLSLLSPSRHQLRSTSNSRANKNLIGRFLRSLLWSRREEERRKRKKERTGRRKRERSERKGRQDEGWPGGLARR